MGNIVLLAEYGLQYGSGGDQRIFGDPAQIAACPVSGRYYVIDTTRLGVFCLSPESDIVEHLFTKTSVDSITVGVDGTFFAIINGGLFRGGEGSEMVMIRKLSSVCSTYITVSASRVCEELAVLRANGIVDVVDFDGNLSWSAGSAGNSNEAVFSLHCDSDGICIVYERKNCIKWFAPRTVGVQRQIGREGARFVPHGLFGPKGIARSPGGYIVADTYNNRVLFINDRDQIVWTHGATVAGGGGPDDLWRPAAIAAGPSGIAIADSKNGRVLVLDYSGKVLKVWHEGAIAKAHLRLPRSIARLEKERLIVADTNHDRLMVADLRRHNLEEVASSSSSLAWPRCARQIAGKLYVTEGREDRIRIGAEVHREFRDAYDPGKVHELRDPHEIGSLPGGNIILTNTGADQILSIDYKLRAKPLLEDVGLLDPHSCCFMEPNRLIVADTGNDRVLIRNSNGETSELRATYRSGFPDRQLSGVRHCSVWDDSRVLLTLTDCNIVLICDLEGRECWHFGPTASNPELLGKTYHYRDSFLHGPKWACRLDSQRIAISDTGNSRILILALPAFE